MVKHRTAVYTGAALAIFAYATVGCESKPATPPPSAPASAPSVDLGSESSAPQESKGAPTETPEATGKP